MDEHLTSGIASSVTGESANDSQPDRRLVVQTGEVKRVLEEYSADGAHVNLSEIALLSQGRALVGVGPDKKPTYLIGRGMIINVPLSLSEGKLRILDSHDVLKGGQLRLEAKVGVSLMQGEGVVSGIMVDTTETKAAPIGEEPTHQGDPISETAAKLRSMPGVQDWIDVHPDPAIQGLFEGQLAA